MPRVCSVCSHPERSEIEALLRNGRLHQNEIAKRYGVSTAALTRHKVHIIRDAAASSPPVEMLKPEEVEYEEDLKDDEGTDLVPRKTASQLLQDLQAKAEKGLEMAEKAQSHAAMAFWFRELRATLKLVFEVGLAQMEIEKKGHKDVSPELQAKVDDIVGGV